MKSDHWKKLFHVLYSWDNKAIWLCTHSKLITNTACSKKFCWDSIKIFTSRQENVCLNLVITKQIIYRSCKNLSYFPLEFELNIQSFVVKNANKIPFSVTRMYLQLGLRVKKFWSFAYCRFLQNTFSTAIYYNGGGVHWQRTKNQVCILRDLHEDRWHTSGGSVAHSGITQAVSLKSCDLFFVLLVTHIKKLNYFKIVEILERTYSMKFSCFFSLQRQLIYSKKENQVETYSITNKYKLRKSQNVFVHRDHSTSRTKT